MLSLVWLCLVLCTSQMEGDTCHSRSECEDVVYDGVTDIDLNAVWKKGQLQAEGIFEEYYGSRIKFFEQFSKANWDFLQPNGDYVGVNHSSNDHFEEENPDPLSHYTNYASAENSELPEAEADDDTSDHELGMGLEDLLPETLDCIETMQSH